MTTKLEQLKNAIWEAVPEIKELKFGCRIVAQRGEIKVGNYEWKDEKDALQPEEIILDSHYDWKNRIGTKKRKNEVCINRYLTPEMNIKYRIVKILGREIRLADILLAFQKLKKNPQSSLAISSYGELKYRAFKKIKEIKYDLSHDSLDWHAANSPETIDWLWEVICKKQ